MIGGLGTGTDNALAYLLRDTEQSADLRLERLLKHAIIWIANKAASYEDEIPLLDNRNSNPASVLFASQIHDIHSALTQIKPPGVIVAPCRIFGDIGERFGNLTDEYFGEASQSLKSPTREVVVALGEELVKEVLTNYLRSPAESHLMKFDSPSIKRESAQYYILNGSRVWHQGHTDSIALPIGKEGTILYTERCTENNLETRYSEFGFSLLDSQLKRELSSLIHQCEIAINRSNICALMKYCEQIVEQICFPSGIDRTKLVKAPARSLLIFLKDSDPKSGFHKAPITRDPFIDRAVIVGN